MVSMDGRDEVAARAFLATDGDAAAESSLTASPRYIISMYGQGKTELWLMDPSACLLDIESSSLSVIVT
jgi:hypothetical protein